MPSNRIKLNKKRVVAGIAKLITDQTLAIPKREAGIRSARAPSENTSELPEDDRTVSTRIPMPASRQWLQRHIVPPACFSWSCMEGLRYPSITSGCLGRAMRQERTSKSYQLIISSRPSSSIHSQDIHPRARYRCYPVTTDVKSNVSYEEDLGGRYGSTRYGARIFAFDLAWS